jgi:DNA polymerase-3 subunit delta'
VAFLRRSLAHGRIPSAYLFLGPHHVGKRTTALALAKALNCAGGGEEGCGRCPSCRKIDEGVHPDVEVVRPDGQFIKIDQVRAIGDKLALIPFEARRRVVILAQAERMNLPAANALLKTLEEPPGDTLLILCAEEPARLPETIRSRCLPVRFGLLSEETVRGLLGAPGGLEVESLDFAVRFAQGRLRPELRERAARWMQVREELIESLLDLHRPVFPQVSERIAQWCGSEDWRFALEWLETWFHDLALLGGGADEARLINGDRLDALRVCGQRITPELAGRCAARVLAVREDIRALNATRPLALEALWLELRRIA